ncbi:MAG TPA: RNA-binding protein, partial [Desulfurococcaceae archaeon]|nr:RNA-binding protein [Desulfurococcaceae archaeon]
FRYSTITVDLAPSITISTEFASVAAIIALITVLEEYNLLPRYQKRKKL